MNEQFARRRVVVAGIATSGVAVADALLDRAARVVVVDGRDGPAEQETAQRLRARGAEVRLGDGETPVEADLVVTSPGWRPTQPLLAASLAAGIEVIGEPELAWRLRAEQRGRAAPWVAVTGTNGKTTTVGMVESILRAAGHRTVAAGNVGLPLITAVLAQPRYDVIAVELSSFQLHWSRDLAPEAAVVLNIADDHLDWHGSFDAYASDKAAIWRAGGCGAFNADDPVVARLAQQSLDDPHPFTLSAGEPGGFGVVDGVIVDRMSGWAVEVEPEPPNRGVDGVPLVAVDDLHVSGEHNVANALAAAAVTRVFGLNGDITVPWPAVGEGLRAYRPGRHRNELVVSIDGVDYVDDSKATNPHAADASLGAYDAVVWVAGGLFKGADVAPLVARHAGRLRGVVVIGLDRAPLMDALRRHAPNVPVVEVLPRDTGVMDQAVAAAREIAQPADTVLLAPAAASMDQFRDYADRGDRFAEAARALAAESR
ncbi:MAG TPA: UDP-N-acetylmuramoyl-L-alanine--D-glutamate ligase [Mycobacteriales bacterium]|nr:UDP-N-acetylmuramoyl-L-alanine--D-glutamate ligase [Mycobacteriales bacterium]